MNAALLRISIVEERGQISTAPKSIRPLQRSPCGLISDRGLLCKLAYAHSCAAIRHTFSQKLRGTSPAPPRSVQPNPHQDLRIGHPDPLPPSTMRSATLPPAYAK